MGRVISITVLSTVVVASERVQRLRIRVIRDLQFKGHGQTRKSSIFRIAIWVYLMIETRKSLVYLIIYNSLFTYSYYIERVIRNGSNAEVSLFGENC